MMIKDAFNFTAAMVLEDCLQLPSDATHFLNIFDKRKVEQKLRPSLHFQRTSIQRISSSAPTYLLFPPWLLI
jgi:hypothetical protein